MKYHENPWRNLVSGYNTLWFNNVILYFAAFSSCLDGFIPTINNNAIELDQCSGKSSVHFTRKQNNEPLKTSITCSITIKAPNSKVEVYFLKPTRLFYLYCNKNGSTLTMTTKSPKIQDCDILNYNRPYTYTKKLTFKWDEDILDTNAINISFKGKMICAW